MRESVESADLAEKLKSGDYSSALRGYRKIIASGQGDAQTYYRAGLACWEIGCGPDGERYFRRAIDLDPKLAGAYEKLIDLSVLSYESDPDPARRRIYVGEIELLSRQLLQQQPNSHVGLSGLGYVYLLRDKSPEAVDTFNKSLAVNRQYEPAAKGIFWSLWKASGFSAAEEFALRYIKENPQQKVLYQILRDTYWREHLDLKAGALMEQRAKDTPTDPRPRLELADAQFRSGRKDSAYATLEQMARDFPKAETLLWIGDAFLANGEVERAARAFAEGRRLDPREPEFVKREALLLARAGHTKKAVEALDLLIASDPKDLNSRLARAEVILDTPALRQSMDLVSDLTSVAKALPRSANAHALLGRALELQGASARAKQEYELARNLEAKNRRALFGLTRLALEADDLRSAQATLGTLLSFDSDNREAQALRAETLIRAQSFAAARARLDQLLVQDPSCEHCLFLAAICDLEEKKYSSAAKVLKRLTSQAYPQAFPALARLYEETGDASSAISLLQSELAKRPTDFGLQLQFVQISAKAKRYDEAAAAADQLTRQRPDRPEAWAAAAEVARILGDQAKAIESLRRAAGLAPGRAEYGRQLAEWLAASGDRLGAIGVLETLTILQPPDPLAMSRLARLQADEGRDLKAALELARRANSSASGHTEIRANLAYLYRLSGSPQDAAVIYRALLIGEPNVLEYHIGLAESLRDQGDRVGARKALGEASRLAVAPSDRKRIDAIGSAL